MPYRRYEGPYLDWTRYHDDLAVQSALLAAAVRDADPATPVPTCPEWTLTDLVVHIGRGLRWAATLVEKGTFVSQAALPIEVQSGAPDALARWLTDSAALLGAAVRTAGAAAPVWSWSADRTAGFWLRRLLHDLLVHRVDAEIAVGRRTPVAPDLAADGISDWLGCVATLAAPDAPDPVLAGLRGTGESLHLHATDEPGEWMVRRVPDGVEWALAHGKADVAVRGSALDLLLVLTRRAAPGDLPVEVFGDRAVLTEWLAGSVF
jgi:uncharacterized protein (TIGR03083 family)